jgi:hypothetical protein
VNNREGRLPHLQSQTLYTLSNLGFWGNNWECVYLCELMLIHELEWLPMYDNEFLWWQLLLFMIDRVVWLKMSFMENKFESSKLSCVKCFWSWNKCFLSIYMLGICCIVVLSSNKWFWVKKSDFWFKNA